MSIFPIYIKKTAKTFLNYREFFVDVLSHVLTTTRFTRYELEESVLPIAQAEAIEAKADPSVHALELAHAIAFRSGLGESLFAQPHSNITADDVAEYAKNVLGKGNVIILGTGISQEKLSQLVEKHLASAPRASVTDSQTTKYYGGETRVSFSEQGQHGPHTVFVGYGLPGQPTAELSVLYHHLSTTPSLKWSTSSSPLASGLPSGASARPVLLQYSDASLFGILIQGETPGDVTEAGKTVAQVFNNIPLKEEDLKRATAKAKFAAASEQDTRAGRLVSITTVCLP